MSDATPASESERHATWPELFFDLVAVAGISVVAHQLEANQPWQHVAVLAVAFVAFWILWASVTTYGNLLADGASVAVLFSSMAVLGIMVASVPEIYGDHARAFAIAYVVGRLIIARPWSRGSVVVDMPIVQATLGVIPWIVSIWIEDDSRYVWWAVGIALDLWVLLTESGEKRVAHAQQRLNRVLAAPRRGRDRSRELPTSVTALAGDTTHRGERMALFILIVLGEGIVQLIAAAEVSEHWNRALFLAALGAFALICELFYIAVVRGTAGLALLPADALPARALWVGHLVVAVSLVTLVAALGQLLEEPSEPVNSHTAWMLALGMAGYGLASAAAHLAGRTPHAGAVAAAIGFPTVAAAAWVLLFHESLRASALGWILALALAVAGACAGRLLAGPRPVGSQLAGPQHAGPQHAGPRKRRATH